MDFILSFSQSKQDSGQLFSALAAKAVILFCGSAAIRAEAVTVGVVLLFLRLVFRLIPKQFIKWVRLFVAVGYIVHRRSVAAGSSDKIIYRDSKRHQRPYHAEHCKQEVGSHGDRRPYDADKHHEYSHYPAKQGGAPALFYAFHMSISSKMCRYRAVSETSDFGKLFFGHLVPDRSDNEEGCDGKADAEYHTSDNIGGVVNVKIKS